MEREALIKKWLDHSLTATEQKQFEQLEDYEQLIKLSDASKSFKAPEYKVEEEQTKLNTSPTQKTVALWQHPLFRVAAILIVALGTFYYTYTLDTIIKTEIAEQKSTTLPDESVIKLNAASTISFNKSKWENKRQVKLDGEAYFKVAKGSKFEVLTSLGKVTVLGTEFNVKQRENYFKVTCYEGRVKVNYKNQTIELDKNLSFTASNDTSFNTTHKNTKPDWVDFESNYKSVQLSLVLADLQRHYNITIDARNIDTKQVFTGSITLKNLDLAMQSLTIPLKMNYSKKGNIIILKRE